MIMLRALFAYFFSLFAIYASGQIPSNNNFFEVDVDAGCAPLSVTVNTTNCGGATSCIVQFSGQTFPTASFPATFSLTQAGFVRMYIIGGASWVDSVDIAVYPDTIPSLTLGVCAGNEVYFNINDNLFDQYEIDFNDGFVTNSLTGTHAYATPGPKTVSVHGIHAGAIDNCRVDNRSITTVTTLSPPIINTLRVLSPTQIQLDFSTVPNVIYKLEVAANGTSGFVPVQDIINQTSIVLSGLDTENNYYCYRMAAYDPCNDTYAYSPIICSALFDLSLQNASNVLSWNTATIPAGYFATVVDYEILRDGVSYYSSVNKSMATQTDLNVTCGVDYCYQHIIHYSNGSMSVSIERCGTTFSNMAPPAIDNIAIRLQTSTADLEWTQPAGYVPSTYNIFRTLDGSNFSFIGTAPGLTFTDSNTAGLRNPCYRIAYSDDCGNQTNLSYHCSILLSGILLEDNQISLNWSDYAGYLNGVMTYRLDKFDVNGASLGSFNLGTATSYVDDTSADLINQVYRYVITATPIDGSLGNSISNVVVIIKDPNLSHPLAFTPGNDNLNEEFRVYGLYVNAYELKIFNRWGELLFVSDNLSEGWDGTYRGKLMPEGTYVFSADVVDFAGRNLNVSGPFTLLRRQ